MRIALAILAGLAIVTALPVPERQLQSEEESDIDWRLEDGDAEMFSAEYLQSFDRPLLKKQEMQHLPKVEDYGFKWIDNKEDDYNRIASEIIHEDASSFWSPDFDTSLMNDEDLDFANDANVIALLLSSADPDYNLIEAAIIMRKEANRADVLNVWQNKKQHDDDQDIHSDT
ncbi:unnamed protein product [Umbelopsis vinacea]|jgi:hypothetical protein